MRLEFDTCNNYSQLYLADAGLASTLAYLNEEEAIHFEQGFSVRRNSVAVATATTNDRYHVVVTDEPVAPDTLSRAVFAIRLPCEFDSGFVFITGRMAHLDPAELARALASGANWQAEGEAGPLDRVFPVKGVISVTFVELPGSKVFIYFSTESQPDAKLLVACERFIRRKHFALSVVPLRVQPDAVSRF